MEDNKLKFVYYKKNEINSDCKNIIHIYIIIIMIDSDKYDPSTASNSYSYLTILNAKNEEVCLKTKDTIAKVYTQDLQAKHEDRFLFSATTMSNLMDIIRRNPNDIFTAQMIIPPNQTFMSSFERLLENTLSQVSHHVDVIVFGGTIIKDEVSDDTLPYDYKDDGKEPLDLVFAIANIIHKIFPSNFRFSHFGVKENHDELLKIKDYALLKNDVLRSFEVLDNINSVSDDTRYEYDLQYLCRVMYDIISKTKINRVELLVKYKISDLEDYNSFKEATEKYGYQVILESNKFTVIKN